MRRFLFIVTCFMILGNALAQKGNAQKGRAAALYNEAKISAQAGDRNKAISLLNQAIKIDPQCYMAFFGLADVYHETGDRELERDALVKGLKTGTDQFPKGYKFLAELLYAGSEYAEALKNMEKYKDLTNHLTPEENKLLESCRFAVAAVKSPVAFKAENAGDSINTDEDEYWPSLNGESNALVFTRLISKDHAGRKIAYPQEDFYISKRDSIGWRHATPLGTTINTIENEGAQCISADGRLLFFTGCGRRGGLGSCDIYMSVWQKGKWSEPVNLGNPVNTGAWESQPSVSADGRWLYFTSNRNGGKGKMDIWRAEKLGVSPEGLPVYGKISNPEDLNTPGNELSPFIHADGRTLYFASDFWPGMGGNDLFFLSLDSTRTIYPQNLGFPINTAGNEEGMVVEVSGRTAWYTSDKTGFGGRDIFTFQLPEAFMPQPVSWVKGRVTNRRTGQLLLADIVLNDLVTNRLVQHMYPFENEGEFLFCLPLGHNYGLNVSKEGYLFHSENFNLLESYNKLQPLMLNIALDPIEIGKTTILRNIFFDTDSFRLKPESMGQLMEIVVFMNKNPRLLVEIGGHTDNQGSESYNLALSAKRAEAVVKALIDMGVYASKLKSKGYGFSTPVADNLTEESRAQNRRTEFRILENK